MASSAMHQKPAVDYFSLSTSKPQNNSFNSPPCWESSPSEFSLPSPESCVSTNQSPKLPSASYPGYKFPSLKDCAKDQVLNFGSFDDWVGWDDPSCNAVSPEQSFFPQLKAEPMSPVMVGLNRQEETGYALQPNQNGMEGGIFREDPTTDEPLFQTQSIPLQPLEQPHSTPISWSRPRPGNRRPQNIRLSSGERSHLRAIAMPSLPPPHPPSRQSKNKKHHPTSISSSSSTKPRPIPRKRKSSTSSLSDDGDNNPHVENSPTRRRDPAPKKTAHNMIEKRYRTNLNDKIAALRDSVPSLRAAVASGAAAAEVGVDDGWGLTPAQKLNKATVLSKATEYISHLERRNRRVEEENAVLTSRVEAFELLMMAGGGNGNGRG